MDAALVNPFIEGALYILDTTASVKVKPEPIFIKQVQYLLETYRACLLWMVISQLPLLLPFIEKVFLELFLQCLEKK